MARSQIRRPPVGHVLTVVLCALALSSAPAGAQPDRDARQLPALAATVESPTPAVAPGEPVTVQGVVTDAAGTPGGARVTATLVAPDSSVLGEPVETTAGVDGAYTVTFPATATEGVTPGAAQGFQAGLAVRVAAVPLDAPADAAATVTQAQQVVLAAPPEALELENSFVSSVGWVKPGETYPFQLIVRNRTDAPVDAEVTVPPVDGTTYVSVSPVGAGAGTAAISDGSIRWDVGTVPAGSVEEPTVRVLVIQARADTLARDEQVVWKDLSTTASVSSGGGTAAAESRGPKVIPPNGTYETARYGDRPFPVVPVAYADRQHAEGNSGADLDAVINDPAFPGSTFNLFQEMSYGQLFPNGTVPSAGIATASFDGVEPEDFHERQVPAPDPDSCLGTYTPDAIGTGDLSERIVDGFYQLPGSTEYYGSDAGAFGDETNPENAGSLDDACGNISKAVYDAAAIADPDIDYNEFDTDKDGIVDFFMMVFAGCGGNGVSQRGCGEGKYDSASYDNIWPHSSSLESGFFDPEAGLTGYVTDDRLTDLEGRLLYYTDISRTATTPEDTGLPAYVRVGPYNVNPEDSLDAASVISHEYGHSLGLPDYYTTGRPGLRFYGAWNLMATDYSQHIDINGRQELGWVVPREVPASGISTASMVDSTIDTNRIEWQTPDGEPYSLSGPDVHNGDAYTVPLPRRILLDPELIENGASPSHVWWSQSGNDFACPPGPTSHSLDIPLDSLADVPEGTPVTLSFNSYWDIEWDYDYGFVLATTDEQTYASIPNEEGYTLPAEDNPAGSACQERYGNGLTGTSGGWEDGDATAERDAGEQTPGSRFLPMTYDLSEYAGQATNLRFAYHTDVGVSRPGWYIDDVIVRAGDQVLFDSDFEDEAGAEEAGIVNAGCDEGFQTGPCTDGWQYVEGGEPSAADHAYYVELRDRTGFDFDGRGQSERGPITWTPGVSLAYTDEARGYGNVTSSDRPNQTVLDSEPTPFGTVPNSVALNPDLSDAAWTETDTAYADFGDGHTDNYVEFDPQTGAPIPWTLAFDCFSLDVTAMTGAGVGPSGPPGDLRADLEMARGSGCGARDYGFGSAVNAAPTAVAQAKATTLRAGEEVLLDGGLSTDDVTPTAELAFAWDFDGDGTVDATTQQATATYDEAGSYDATLTVTDEGDRSDSDTIAIRVLAGPPAGPGSPGGPAAPGHDPEPEPQPDPQPDPEPTTPPRSSPQEEPDLNVVSRLAGPGRIETAIEISQAAFETADAVVLARADQFPDALAAATLAAEVEGPVLLTGSDQLDLRVAREILRLGARTVYLAGGEVALSAQVEGDLTTLEVGAPRLEGVERTDTAARIAEEVVAVGGPVDQVVLARADDFADALAAGNVGTTGRAPILLTSGDELSGPAAAALEALVPGGEVLVAGGEVAIGSGVTDGLTDDGHAVRRLAGPTRLDTAVAIVDEAVAQGAGRDPIFLASGFAFPDALAAAPAAHALGGSLLLADPAGLGESGPLGGYLAEHAAEIDTAYVTGGVEAVAAEIDAEVRRAVTAEGEGP